jgi:hypothetical protein
MAALFIAITYDVGDFGARLRLVWVSKAADQESSGAEVGWVALLSQNALLCPMLFRPHPPMSGTKSTALDRTCRRFPLSACVAEVLLQVCGA